MNNNYSNINNMSDKDNNFIDPKYEYFQKRGINKSTVDNFAIKYAKNWSYPGYEKKIYSDRILIYPDRYTDDSYMAIDIRDNIPEKQKPYKKQKVGKSAIFNFNTIYESNEPIHVVEGQIDAMSITQEGGHAIALCGCNFYNEYLKKLKSKKPSAPFIISLDNDEAGEKNSKIILKQLLEIGINAKCIHPPKEYNDHNEFLVKNKEGFRKWIQTNNNAFKNSKFKPISETIVPMYNRIFNNNGPNYIPTGFKNLDSVLEGGLYPELYVLGAMSSLGKTTLLNQISDQIAAKSYNVLYISLEMPKDALILKSISRTAIENQIKGNKNHLAINTRKISDKTQIKKMSEEDKNTLHNIIMQYRDESNTKCIIDNNKSKITINDIEKNISDFVKEKGKKTVIFIDYMQIISLEKSCKVTDKQKMDIIVNSLANLSHSYGIPIIAISSLNRTSYNNPVTMEAFKESGDIEYSADNLLALQYKNIGKDGFDLNKAKAEAKRELELVILKSRNGRVGDNIKFRYYAEFNCFQEDD